jgi:Xaa-Pro aminopeptidase
LWTDGRYALQAKQELDPSRFELLIQAQGVVADIPGWLQTVHKPVRVGVDPRTISPMQSRELQAVLKNLGGSLVFFEQDPVQQLWDELEPRSMQASGLGSQASGSRSHVSACVDEPGFPPHGTSAAHIRIQPVMYAGLSAREKLDLIRKEMTTRHVDALVLNTLDEIAWLFNVRGADIAYNPLVISYALITQTHADWYVDMAKIHASPELEAYLHAEGIHAHAYEHFGEALQRLHGRVWLDDRTASAWMVNQLTHATLWTEQSPIVLPKAIKNQSEIQGMIDAHVHDGVALTQFLHWLEHHWKEGVTELMACDKLREFRAKSPLFLGESFRTISGFGPHGAIIHYSVTEKTDEEIHDTGLFLLDSGAQYPMGTTDVTRTIHLGTPTQQEKQDYTRVLKGHLGIRHSIFPKGTNGTHIDVLAKQALWKVGKNFLHGTGHGVGAHLCVHEGPHVISPRMRNTPLMPGMVVSNEPGYYWEGHYGIRIENLCYVVEKTEAEFKDSPYGPFYGFEDLTWVPLETKLMDLSMMTSDEIHQVDAYHQQVYLRLKPLMPAELHGWLKAKTAPLMS